MTLTDAWQPGHCDWRRGQARKLKRRGSTRRAPAAGPPWGALPPPPPRTRRRHPEGEPSRGRARWAASGPQPPAVGPPAVGPPAQAWSAVERPTPGAQAPLNRFAALDTLTASSPGSKELASQGGHRWLTERHQFWSSDLRLLAIPYLMHLETVFDM
ncbi:transcription initiation factor TFIID subunit 4-like [Canis lupus familiaris]|uniref:transcription initiation factor TFIID subunit 4-like n=1 Tax=Canis lupus familiaris TaxID=9615 RepID=UPI0018F3A073|nr:transcription initiation factor TFIID subunit 4-like [Canis lupus familiaris]